MNHGAIISKPPKPQVVTEFNKSGRSLLREVSQRSGTNVTLCFHCRTCANGCPFLKGMDYHPNAVLRCGPAQIDLAYFPGCSLATTAMESNVSLMQSARILGLNLIELEDWNCCGSSSAPTFSQELSLGLAARNLSLVPAGRPLVVMCPRCLFYLRRTQSYLTNEPATHRVLEEHWGRAIPLSLKIRHFLEVLVGFGLDRLQQGAPRPLKGLRFFPYYGCTVFRPANMAQEKYYQGEMENILVALGAEAVFAAYTHRCCGSFLSATDPDLVTPLVNQIIESAVNAGAQCVVTACAMCQLNLEIRSTARTKIPVFHFSEVLALALGAEDYENWFSRHLVDPRPLIQELALVA